MDKTFGKILGVALVKPFRLIATQSIIRLFAAYTAYLLGIVCLILSTFPELWEDVYRESAGIGGLHRTFPGLGHALGAQGNARLSDTIYWRLKHRVNDIGVREYRTSLIFVASVLIPIGLFWYGWSAEAAVH